MNSDMRMERSQGLVSNTSNLALVTEYELLMKLFESDEFGHFAFTDYYFDMLDYLSDEICKRYIDLLKYLSK